METFDVVVIGSGAAGLFTTLAAAARGMQVLVLEKAPKLGGGTAISSGLLWVGANHFAPGDSPEAARDYLRFVGAGAVDEFRLSAFIDTAPTALLHFLALGLPFQLTGRIDHYHGVAPGAVPKGRIVETVVVEGEVLGMWQGRVALPPNPLFRLSNNEVGASGGVSNPATWAAERLRDREARDVRGHGAGLVSWLVKIAIGHGVVIRTGTAADRLLTADGRVCGVVTRDGGEIGARRGVVLAAGGYESNADLVRNYESLPGWQSMFPETITGDGLVMAQEIGAAVWTIHNNHAVFLGFRNPDEAPGGVATCRLSGTQELVARHTMVVNRAGRRFVDESFFQAIAPVLAGFDMKARGQPNLPCFLIFDSQYTAGYSFAGRPPGAPVPRWVPRAETLAELAGQLGVDPVGLAETTDRFNRDAAGGRDSAFHRGEMPWGQMRVSASSSLGPIDRPPFFGIELHPTAIGSAGLLADADACVMHVRGRPIPGLYAVGNAAAHTEYGSGYQTGLSLTSAMAFGLRAAVAMEAAES